MMFREASIYQSMDLIASADTTSIAEVLISVNGELVTVPGLTDIQELASVASEALAPFEQTAKLEVRCGVRRSDPKLVEGCSFVCRRIWR